MDWLLNACRVFAKPWIQRALFAVTAVVVGLWLIELLGQLDLVSRRIDYRWVAAAFLMNMIYLFGYVTCWHILTHVTGAGLPFRHSAPIWLFSILGKYVPGRIVGIATRVSLIDQHRPRTGGIVAATCVLESMASTAAGLLACTLISVFAAAGLQSSIGLPPLVPLVIGLAAVIATPVMYRAIRWALRKRLADSTIAERIPPGRWTAIIVFYSCLWMLWGTILVAVVAAVDTSLAFDSVWSIMWIYQVAGITGIIALFTPSGLGAREAVMLAGLLLIVPGPIAALITVGARLVNVTAEALGIAAGYAMLGQHRKGIGHG